MNRSRISTIYRRKLGRSSRSATTKIKQVKQYECLVSNISSEGASQTYITNRVQQFQKCVKILNSLLWSNKKYLKLK